MSNAPDVSAESLRRTRRPVLRVDRLTNAERAQIAREASEVDRYARPRTRLDCLPGGINGARPCPFVSCKHHLYLDVSYGGSVVLNADVDADELHLLADTCALDVSERGGATQEGIAGLLGVTHQRAEQIESDALAKLRERAAPLAELLEGALP